MFKKKVPFDSVKLLDQGFSADGRILPRYKTIMPDNTIKKQPIPAFMPKCSLNTKYPIDNPNINLVYLNGVMADTSPIRMAEIKDP